MSAINNKIQSNRGASITFALMLFMVCAIISIVVVVAGSAAAGSMSQRAETDQRYYAVSSAVELLCNDFKNKVATVKYTKASTASSVSGESITVESLVDSTDTTVPKIELKGITPFVAEASRYLVEKIANPPDTVFTDPQFSLKTSLDTEDNPKIALKCTIQERMYRDGRLVFVVSNTPSGANDSVYTLQVTFTASISESSSEYTDNGRTMKDVITTIEWKFGGIKKGA